MRVAVFFVVAANDDSLFLHWFSKNKGLQSHRMVQKAAYSRAMGLIRLFGCSPRSAGQSEWCNTVLLASLENLCWEGSCL